MTPRLILLRDFAERPRAQLFFGVALGIDEKRRYVEGSERKLSEQDCNLTLSELAHRHYPDLYPKVDEIPNAPSVGEIQQFLTGLV